MNAPPLFSPAYVFCSDPAHLGLPDIVLPHAPVIDRRAVSLSCSPPCPHTPLAPPPRAAATLSHSRSSRNVDTCTHYIFQACTSHPHNLLYSTQPPPCPLHSPVGAADAPCPQRQLEEGQMKSAGPTHQQFSGMFTACTGPRGPRALAAGHARPRRRAFLSCCCCRFFFSTCCGCYAPAAQRAEGHVSHRGNLRGRRVKERDGASSGQRDSGDVGRRRAVRPPRRARPAGGARRAACWSEA